MTDHAAAPNVWTQMSYVPPRGQCNFKQSLVSGRCPCLRFMLHPLKSASSYECDGCSHHASFHAMENKYEDEIRKRWEQEAKEKQQEEETIEPRSRKRLREIEYTESPLIGMSENLSQSSRSRNETASNTAKGKPKKGNDRGVIARGAATRARGKVTEVFDDDDVLDLD